MPDKPKTPEECLAVADLIDLYVGLRQTRPEKSGNGDNTEREAHIDREVESETALATALAYYGTVLWRGQVWTGTIPPRVYRICHTAFGGYGNRLRWPPNRPDTEQEAAAKAVLAFPNEPNPTDQSVPAIPEKIAGYISEDKFSQ